MSEEILREKRFESLVNKRNCTGELIMEMCEVKRIVENVKEKTILELKNKKRDTNCKFTVREVMEIFKDNLREEYSSILTPEMIAAGYVVSVKSPIEIKGKHYMMKYIIPSPIAFISFIEAKIGINKIVDEILQLIN